MTPSFPTRPASVLVVARVERATPDRLQLSVLRAAGPGERVLRIAGIDPGAQLLLHATTTARTELALQAIAAIEAQRIALDEVNEDYWWVLHQRLVAGIEAPPYTAAEHAARSDERRVGKECVSTCRSRWSPSN